MKIANIIEETTVDGPGIRTSIYFQGCPIHCKGCQNKLAQSITGGYEKSAEEIVANIQKDPFLTGVSILGGEPFYQSNDLYELVKEIRHKCPKLTIWVYSGYYLQILKANKLNCEILKLIDVLVDGPYVEELRDTTLRFRGSKNQRIIENPGQFI